MSSKEVLSNRQHAIRIYCCYHPKNESCIEDLEIHFAALKRQGQIVVSHKILPGAVQKHEIDAFLSSADIILLLISPYFFNSDTCWDNMSHALQLHKAGKACVIPILVSPVDYEATPIGTFQTLPRKKPLSRFSDRQEGYVEIVRGVREVMQRFFCTD